VFKLEGKGAEKKRSDLPARQKRTMLRFREPYREYKEGSSFCLKRGLEKKEGSAKKDEFSKREIVLAIKKGGVSRTPPGEKGLQRAGWRGDSGETRQGGRVPRKPRSRKTTIKINRNVSKESESTEKRRAVLYEEGNRALKCSISFKEKKGERGKETERRPPAEKGRREVSPREELLPPQRPAQ